MSKIGKKEVTFRGKKIMRSIFEHCLGNQIVKINNVWFKVNGDVVSEDYIKYDPKLYVLGTPAKIDLFKLNLIAE